MGSGKNPGSKEALGLCGCPGWARLGGGTGRGGSRNLGPEGWSSSRAGGGGSRRVRYGLKEHGIDTALGPHRALWNILVHPGDGRDVAQTAVCVCGVPCLGCERTYVGGTSGQFGIRLGEHKAESDGASREACSGARERPQFREKQMNP